MPKTKIPEDIELEEAPQPSDNEIKSVAALAREQWKLEKRIGELQEQLETAKTDLKDIRERELPSLMNELDIDGLKLSNGAQLDLETNIYGNIKKDDLPKAIKWLEDHNFGDLVTREYKIKFTKEQERWAAKFQRDLNQRKKPLNADVKRTVHAQTLNKFVRDCEAEGIVIPIELFGVFKKKTTKITVKSK